MVQEVSCKKQSQLQKEYLDQLPLAKERIKQFPILNRNFNNFNLYEDGTYYENSRNIIFRTCIRRPQTFWIPLGSTTKTVLVDSTLFPTLLQEIENAIVRFAIDKSWTVNEKKDLIINLTSPDSHTSRVAVSELLIPYRIDTKIGPNKVKIKSRISSGKRPDVLLNIGNNKQLYIELTSLKPRTSEEKIGSICKDAANYLNGKCQRDNYTIFIHFDTSVLIPIADSRGDIDELGCKKFLRGWIDKLFLYELAGSDGNIYFGNSSVVEDFKFLIDVFNDNLGAISLSPELYKMINEQEIVSGWAKKVRFKDFNNSPFENVTYRKAADNGCVMVNTAEFDSTSEALLDKDILKTSRAVKMGFKSQLKRTINYKIDRKQYVEKSPVIVAINAFEWRYMFEEDYDEFAELRDIIQNEMAKAKWMSGVIIYYSDLYNGRYIENRNASKRIQLTEKELVDLGIIKKYNNPVMTHDKQLDLDMLSREEQVESMDKLIENEPTLNLKEDKIELLRLIESFLLTDNLPKSTILKLQPIIRKYCNDPDPSDESSLKIDIPDTGVFSYPALRSSAIACQLRITWQNPTSENINLCTKMFSDKNSLVREEACKNLGFLALVNHEISLDIAKKLLYDNWRVRFFLTDYLRYLGLKHQQDALDLCGEIIRKFGKVENRKGLGENASLRFVISMIVVKSLSDKDVKYSKILSNLVKDESYCYETKRQIAFECKRDEIIRREDLIGKLLKIYTKLAKHKLGIIREDAIFFLLYTLTTINKSWLPMIRTFLKIASVEKIEYQGILHGRFQILKYLEKFWEEIPENSAVYINNVFNANPNPRMYIGYSTTIKNLLSNLLKSKIVSNKSKSNLRIIIRKLRSANSNFDQVLRTLE